MLVLPPDEELGISKRVAVSIENMEGLNSQIDPRFGRARAFIVVELKNMEVAAEFTNTAASAAQGAGTAAAVAMNINKVDVVSLLTLRHTRFPGLVRTFAAQFRYLCQFSVCQSLKEVDSLQGFY